MKQINKLSAFLALIALGTPFIWMKIGPGGYAYYGPTVPDIYIFGGFISGKDITFAGISFAIVFQLTFIVYFITNCLRAARSNSRERIIKLGWINFCLLLLFPSWLQVYVNGVINNSDAADLTVHYHAGMIIYLALAALNIAGLVKVYLKRIAQ